MKRLLLFLSCVLLTPTAIWAMDVDDEQQTEFEYFEGLPKEIQQKIFLQKILSQDTVDGVIDTVEFLRKTNKLFYNLVITGGRSFINPILEHLCDVFIKEQNDYLKENIELHTSLMHSDNELIEEYNQQKNIFFIKLELLCKILNVEIVTVKEFDAVVERVLIGNSEILGHFLGYNEHLSQFVFFNLIIRMISLFSQRIFSANFDRSLVEVFQTYGVDIFTPLLNCNLLMIAIINNFVDVVAYLIEQGIDVNYKNSQNLTAIGYAVYGNLKKIVKLLLKTDADINYRVNYFTANILEVAIKKGNIEIATWLLEHGADTNNPQILIRACRKPDVGSDFIRMLLDNGAEIHDSVLLSVAKLNKTDVVRLFLEEGVARINYQDSNGYTPLMHAVENDNISMINLLLQNGADLFLQNDDEQTALGIAKEEGLELATIILQQAEMDVIQQEEEN